MDLLVVMCGLTSSSHELYIDSLLLTLSPELVRLGLKFTHFFVD